jgi:hypothetical protein
MTVFLLGAAGMPKTEFLQIRCTPEDRARMQKVAATEHLDLSTWARRLLLQAVDETAQPKPLLELSADRSDA